MNTIYSLGYTGAKVQTLETFLRETGARVADVRLKPFSRNYQWAKGSLVKVLGGRYEHLPELGNLNYKGGAIVLAEPEKGYDLLRLLLVKGPVVVLCVCADATTCHRTVITTRLAREGYPVVQLSADLQPVAELQPSLL